MDKVETLPNLFYEVMIKLISKYVKDKTVKQKPIFCQYHSLSIICVLILQYIVLFIVQIWAPPFFAKFAPVSYLDVLVNDDSF